MADPITFTETITAIMTLIEYSQTLYSLFGGDAQDTITLEDVARLINSTNVNLFAGNEFAGIKTIRDKFYDVYLPTITAQSSIKQVDIIEPGFLAETYGSIKTEKDTVWKSLQKLDWIFSNNDLHVDDYNFFTRLICQGYVLLLHMHSVTQNLRSVELLGVVDLDNYKLLPETLTLLDYINKGLEQVAKMDNRVCNLRLGQISEVKTDYICIGESACVLYSWNDEYQKLSSTLWDQAITGDKLPGSCSEQPGLWGDTKKNVIQKRTERVAYIKEVYNALTGNDLSKLTEKMTGLKPKIEGRVTKQGGKVAPAPVVALP
ncbi:uncharacterized protein EDB91DRAFT_734331 [Suillus paluster]|uniref:uncharacterized protein n=1 Tax=Suillus paluster TaxID=48578 RepID=UPI001B86FE3B|nr:uncharacterized protein EDB91DRAFT_734331 [Suillus paluster]KAG1731081.1 hypothetical protein EDB91DRAFT_734331 [Suillus paluster]